MWIKWIELNWIKQRVESGVNVNKLDFVILSNVICYIVLCYFDKIQRESMIQNLKLILTQVQIVNWILV